MSILLRRQRGAGADMYLVSAALLSLLPFAIVGGIVWCGRRAGARVTP
jgi:hypothetical protein